MRAIAALAIYVSMGILAGVMTTPALAAEWQEMHQQGLEASRRQEIQAAEALFRKSWDAAATPVEQAFTANDLGVTLHALNRDAEAKVWLDRAMPLWPRQNAQLFRLAQTAEALAVVDRLLGDYAAAESALRQVLALNPPDAESQGILMNELGDIVRELGRTTEARALFEKVSRLPGISARVVFDATAGVADLDREEHLWASSIEGWSRASGIARDSTWSNLEAITMRGLGDTLLDEGETARAEPLLRKALAVFDGWDGGERQVASTLASLGRLYLADGRPAMAEDALRRAIAINERTMGANHPQLAVLLEMLGDSAARRERLAEARTHYERARLIMTGNFGENSPMAAAVQASWALVELRARQAAAATADYEAALTVLAAASSPEGQALRVTVMRHYAEALDASHRKRDASAVRLQVKAALSSTSAAAFR